MSIINEALKKAVREKGATLSPQDNEMVRKNIEIEFQKKKPLLNWGPIFILLVLVLITGPIIAPIFSTPFRTSAELGTLSPKSGQQNVPVYTPTMDMAKSDLNEGALATRKAQFAIEESPVFGNSMMPGIARIPSLALSGIVYSAEESYCIINNKIVKIGEWVQGAKLLSVSRNVVTVQYQGKTMTLSVGSD